MRHVDIEFVAVSYRVDAPDDHFQMSKYPVTVAQFAAFVSAGGYGRRELWSERGWAWRSQHEFTRPTYWEDGDYHQLQFPVTGISFWEAEAFARFADASLPTEQEWLMASSNHGTTRYPWGAEYADDGPRRANLNFFGALETRGLRPVDQYPEGQSKAGIWDLLGNVSEWCLPSDGEQLPADAKTGVLRGGCFWHTSVAVDAGFFDIVSLHTRDNQTGIRLVRRPAKTATATAKRPVVASPSVVTKRFDRKIKRPSAPFRQEGVPASLTRDAWRLRITGDVASPIELSLDTLMNEFPRTELSGLFVCVCRWGELNHFAGVSVKDLVARVAPTQPLDKLYLHQQSVVGPSGKAYEAWVSLADAIDHGALLAYEMDGQPLTMDLGWPLRLVDLHLFAYKTVKCLAELRFTTTMEMGWWETECQYDPHGIVQPGVITVVGERSYKRVLDSQGRVTLTADERAFLDDAESARKRGPSSR